MARIDILWLGLFIQLTFFIHTRWEYFGAWSDVFTRDFWPNGSTFTSACRPWFLIAIHVPMYTFFVLVRILFLNSTKASLFSDSLLWILSVTWYPRGTEREKHTSMYLSFLFRFFDSVWYFERFIEAAYRKSCSFNYLSTDTDHSISLSYWVGVVQTQCFWKFQPVRHQNFLSEIVYS